MYKPIHDTHNLESGTPNWAQSGRSTKDRKSKHPITSKLIIIAAYLKSTTDKVLSAVESLIMCCLKMALCGQNI
jgi:hypothetical protein